ncbi:MAG: ATP-binding protein [Ignavibacteriaceae bacterium]|nr:ATP-binding protein [Ignavibacteriaceae bacterium]
MNLRSGLINVIIGPRRAGKSFFALHSLADEKFGYANFDDEKLVGIENYDEITEAIDRIYASPEIILFDEIQNLPKWELFVNRLQRQGRKIVITGSNSNLLSGELATHLTGRNYPVYIFPFSYNELFSASGQDTEMKRREIYHNLLENGGYPEVAVRRSDSKEYLRMIFRDTIYKEIVARYKPRDPVMVSKIAEMLITGIGSAASLRTVSDTTGYNERTASKYISYIINTIIFFQLPRFSYKVKEQHKSVKKIYAIDNGFINSIGFNSTANRGRKLENLVASELYKRSLKKGEMLHYWKKEYECDFVVQSGGKVTEIIQVSADVSNPKTLNREMRALTVASSELNCDNLTIVTEGEKSVRQFEWYGKKKEIYLVPFVEWVESC